MHPEFCSNCGAKVKMLDGAASDDDHGTPEDKGGAVAQTTSKSEETVKSPRKHKAALWSAVVAVLVVVVILFAVFNKPKLSTVVQGSIYRVTAAKESNGKYKYTGYIAFSNDGRYAFPLSKNAAKDFASESFTKAYANKFATIILGGDVPHVEHSTYNVDDKADEIKLHNWISNDDSNVHGKFIVSKYSKDTVDLWVEGQPALNESDVENYHLHLKKVGITH